MTAAELKKEYLESDYDNKIEFREKCIRLIPISRASFYRKLTDCLWSESEMYFIENKILKTK